MTASCTHCAFAHHVLHEVLQCQTEVKPSSVGSATTWPINMRSAVRRPKVNGANDCRDKPAGSLLPLKCEGSRLSCRAENAKIWQSDCNRMFTADKSASVGMQVWGHVGPRQMKMPHTLFLFNAAVKKLRETLTLLIFTLCSQASTVPCAPSSWRRTRSRSTCWCVSARRASHTTVGFPVVVFPLIHKKSTTKLVHEVQAHSCLIYTGYVIWNLADGQ